MMNDAPFFSLIIPTYNRANYIGKTLQSVSAQSFQDFEVIIVDDGSTDNTAEVINALGLDSLRYIKIENSERGAARNKGMELARGEYFTFLDSDDWLEPIFFEEAKNFILKSHFPKFSHLGYAVYSSDGKLIRKMDSYSDSDISFIIKGNPLSCIGVLLHRSLFPTYKFNEDRRLSGSEDWELWIRILANHGIKSNSKPLARIIDHADRSVLHFKENDLVMRKSLAVTYAMSDPMVRKVFGKNQFKIDAFWNSYVALHLVISKEKWKCLQYLLIGMILDPRILLEKRIIVIIRLLLKF